MQILGTRLVCRTGLSLRPGSIDTFLICKASVNQRSAAMSLFTAAARQLTKAVGGKTLHPTLDLNSADRFQPLCLVKERKSFWPWRKPKITPTLVTLNDVLKEEIKDVNSFIKKLKIVEGYKRNPQFLIDGDIGSKIAEELSIDISTVDKFEAEVSFGDIIKSEVDWEGLERKLSVEKFNMNHQLWLEMKGKKRTNICIVVESLSNAADGSLSGDMDEKASASGGIHIPVSKVTVDVHTKGDAEKKRHLTYDIPAGTILAYSCTRLAINDAGTIRMQVQLDRVDSAAPVVIEDNTDIGAIARQEFQQLRKSKDKEAITKCFLHLLQSSTIQGLFDLFAVAETTSSDHHKYSRKLAAVKGEIGGDPKVWMELLTLLGFEISEDQPDVHFPVNDPDGLIQACVAVTESLLDFTNNQLQFLKESSKSNALSVLSVLKGAIAGEESIEAAGLNDDQSAEVKLLQNFGFQLVKSDGKNKFNLTPCDSDEALRNLYIAVYVLLGE